MIYVLETKKTYPYNDVGTGWSAGVTPGSSESASNGQCTLQGAGSSVATSGNDLTLNVALSFTNTFVSQKIVFLQTLGRTQSALWVAAGTWIP